MGLKLQSKPVAGAVLVAAGSGTRLKSKTRKALVQLGRKPLFEWSLAALLKSPLIGEVCLVAHPADAARLGKWARGRRFSKPVKVVPGGTERQDSVARGLSGLAGDWKVCLVQDAARPFLSQSLINACLDSALSRGSGIAAVPVKDSIKRLKNGKVTSLPREELWAAQTPQAARLDWLRAAHAWAHKAGRGFTDEAGLLEARGRAVRLVLAYPENIKITTPEDLPLAAKLLADKRFFSTLGK